MRQVRRTLYAKTNVHLRQHLAELVLLLLLLLLLLLELLQKRVVEKIKTRIFNNFFLIAYRAVHEIEKWATDDNMASCALHAS